MLHFSKLEPVYENIEAALLSLLDERLISTYVVLKAQPQPVALVKLQGLNTGLSVEELAGICSLVSRQLAPFGLPANAVVVYDGRRCFQLLGKQLRVRNLYGLQRLNTELLLDPAYFVHQASASEMGADLAWQQALLLAAPAYVPTYAPVSQQPVALLADRLEALYTRNQLEALLPCFADPQLVECH